MALTVEALSDAPVAKRRLELVERMGLGDSDTICDSLAPEKKEERMPALEGA